MIVLANASSDWACAFMMVGIFMCFTAMSIWGD